jgi:hypothetical protein
MKKIIFIFIVFLFPLISHGAVIISSYSESNWSQTRTSYTNADNWYIGQSFLCNKNAILDSAKFYLNGSASLTGNIFVYIYDHAGTFGSAGKATGTPLATSDPVSASSLGSMALRTFTFSGANRIALYPGFKYVAVFSYQGGDSTHSVSVGSDYSTHSAAGNETHSNNGTTWLNYSNNDIPFYVYGINNQKGAQFNSSVQIKSSISIN